MICEPNTSLPQNIDLESLRNSDKIIHLSNVEKQKSFIIKHRVSKEPLDYNIFPVFTDQDEHLNEVLSLHINPYLACRWNQFLNNVPKNYVRIHLYKDFKSMQSHSIIKRKNLNGKFYGVDNKLAPIPVLSDPRNIR